MPVTTASNLPRLFHARRLPELVTLLFSFLGISYISTWPVSRSHDLLFFPCPFLLSMPILWHAGFADIPSRHPLLQ